MLYPGEIRIKVYNLPEDQISFTAERILGIKWYPKTPTSPGHSRGEIIFDDEYDTVEVIADGRGSPNYREIFFDTEGDDGGNYLGLTFYELKIENKNNIYFINTEHCDNLQDWEDIPLTYDYDSGIMYWGHCDPAVNCYGEVSNRTILTPFNNQATSCLEDYWDNCLLIIPSISGNHPRLVWGPHPTFTATNYKVYRALSDNPANPLSLTYYLLGTVSSSTFSKTDLDITIDPSPDKYAYYYVKAYNSNTEMYSDRTNIEDVAGDYAPQKQSVPLRENFKYSISQNYPNPFNPTTEISYSIAKEGFVNLTVYDILGREVAKLVNEEKLAGSYTVNFNSTHLSSGIYFYKITSGEFASIKKLNVLK